MIWSAYFDPMLCLNWTNNHIIAKITITNHSQASTWLGSICALVSLSQGILQTCFGKKKTHCFKTKYSERLIQVVLFIFNHCFSLFSWAESLHFRSVSLTLVRDRAWWSKNLFVSFAWLAVPKCCCCYCCCYCRCPCCRHCCSNVKDQKRFRQKTICLYPLCSQYLLRDIPFVPVLVWKTIQKTFLFCFQSVIFTRVFTTLLIILCCITMIFCPKLCLRTISCK